MEYTLGIDIGTYETKGVIVNTDGQVIASEAKPHKLIVPQPGWAEHRPDEDWWDDFVFISNSLLKTSGISPKDIIGVATSAIGPCMVPIDKDGNPQMNGVLYGVDTRSTKQIEELDHRIGKKEIFDCCGNALTSQSTGPKTLWFKQTHPELWKKNHKILTSTSYIVYKLTGEYVMDHFTAVNYAPWYDINKLDWTDKLASDVPLEKFPKLAWSTDIVGTITLKAEQETGLKTGTPVTCGTIDAAAEAISVGVQNNGDMMMMYGSTIFIIEVENSKRTDPRLWYAPWVFSEQFAIMAGVPTAGTLTHWFKNQIAKDLNTSDVFPKLEAEASTSPIGANGIICIPYFSGGLTPIHNPNARGVFFGLNLTHNRADLFRSLLEGISAGTRWVLETYDEASAFPKKVIAVGGGTKNNTWIQSTSDMCHINQQICKYSLGASYGDAFLAALALNRVKKEDIFQWNPVSQTVNAKKQDVYENSFPLFKKLYFQSKEIADKLAEN